jgi:hypothetical protein
MNDAVICSAENKKLSLKESSGWFAAGSSFRRALTVLSDGAFRLFALICLEADRQTGGLEASYSELAKALGKSKRAIGGYVAELEKSAVCQITAARNQHGRTTFQVRDEFWPYRRISHAQPPADAELQQYIDSVWECCRSLGDVQVGFGPSDVSIAKDLYERRIPLGVIRDAMLLGACRKYESWLNGGLAQPIRTLRYFEQIITEVRNEPLPAGYSNYLRLTLKRYATVWAAAGGKIGRTQPVPFPGTAGREGTLTEFPPTANVLAQKSNRQGAPEETK